MVGHEAKGMDMVAVALDPRLEDSGFLTLQDFLSVQRL